MTKDQVQSKIGRIETAIATQNFSMNQFGLLAGQWQGLKQSIGETEEGAWAMLWRLRGI